MIGASGRLGIDAWQAVLELVLLDNPDTSDFFQLGERDQLDLGDLGGAGAADLFLGFQEAAQPPLTVSLGVGTGDRVIVEQLHRAVHASEVAPVTVIGLVEIVT